METQIAGSIARMDGSTSQDAIFKDVLAYKEVLAHIMKTCVPEYITIIVFLFKSRNIK